MMLIRPPVVREMRRSLWASMTAKPEDFASQSSPPAAGRAEDAGAERLARLRELGELRESGVLTEEEFAREKARILG